MTIEQFIKLANKCSTKIELASLAKANGVSLSGEMLDKIFKKINDGFELSDDTMESVAGGLAFGASEALLQNFIDRN